MDKDVIIPKGYLAAGGSCGIKQSGMDLALIFSDIPAQASAVMTNNQFKAAPLIYNQEVLEHKSTSQAIVINSGVANAATGPEGLLACRQVAMEAGHALGISSDNILLASTGVIGLPLPVEKIGIGVKDLVKNLSPKHFEIAAQAIMTTDTYPKMSQALLKIGDQEIRFLGMAKGAGMICPNMSTMLGFILTDARVEDSFLHKSLKEAVKTSFNMITVDGDTSTNDTVIVMANGAGGGRLIEEGSPEAELFRESLANICVDLARQIAKDGEGASRLIEVLVSGTQTDAEARACAKSVVGSSLVKTAVFGQDPNWGRIACALGYAGVPFQTKDVSVWVGDIMVCKDGGEIPFNEEAASMAMGKDEVLITCHLGDGPGRATAWGCDLTYDYVRINAEYRS